MEHVTEISKAKFLVAGEVCICKVYSDLLQALSKGRRIFDIYRAGFPAEGAAGTSQNSCLNGTDDSVQSHSSKAFEKASEGEKSVGKCTTAHNGPCQEQC